MRKVYILLLIATLAITSCTTTAPLAKSVAYKGMYEEKPSVALIMPPINRSTNVEAKEFFHSTLYTPLADAGYYVIPPFLSMEILKKESAFDSELFLDTPLNKFAEVFGADMVVFTIIHKWDKSSLASNVNVDIEFIIKSAKTNEILYTRRGEIRYNTSVSSGLGGLGGLVADLTLSALNTAGTKYVDVARVCNYYILKDFPAGNYSLNHGLDGAQLAGLKSFKVNLSAK
ncbi:GNA1162 family protein [Flavobacterium sp.]|uniref:GNA1162 family protein n=1 Tax=Flavobacterium sp. TaxID=239 RepID=UPI003751B542